MKRGSAQKTNRKFKIKNTLRYEAKMIKVRTNASATREAIQRELMKKRTISDEFFTYCLEEAQNIQNRLDPEGLSNIKCTYQCKFCHKIFMKSTALGGHISKVHKQHKIQQIVKKEPEMQVKMEQMSQIYYSDNECTPKYVKIQEKPIHYVQSHKIIKKKRGRKSKKDKELQSKALTLKLQQEQLKNSGLQ